MFRIPFFEYRATESSVALLKAINMWTLRSCYGSKAIKIDA